MKKQYFTHEQLQDLLRINYYASAWLDQLSYQPSTMIEDLKDVSPKDMKALYDAARNRLDGVKQRDYYEVTELYAEVNRSFHTRRNPGYHLVKGILHHSWAHILGARFLNLSKEDQVKFLLDLEAVWYHWLAKSGCWKYREHVMRGEWQEIEDLSAPFWTLVNERVGGDSEIFERFRQDCHESSRIHPASLLNLIVRQALTKGEDNWKLINLDPYAVNQIARFTCYQPGFLMEVMEKQSEIYRKGFQSEEDKLFTLECIFYRMLTALDYVWIKGLKDYE